MRRKTNLKIAPVVQINLQNDVKEEPVTPATTETTETTKTTENTNTIENTKTTESTESTVSTSPKSPKSKTHKKKLRRPVHSDTIPAIPVASFHRMARFMAEDVKSDLRWEAEALQALQVAAEAFMVEKFQKAKETSNICARRTISAELLRV